MLDKKLLQQFYHLYSLLRVFENRESHPILNLKSFVIYGVEVMNDTEFEHGTPSGFLSCSKILTNVLSSDVCKATGNNFPMTTVDLWSLSLPVLKFSKYVSLALKSNC